MMLAGRVLIVAVMAGAGVCGLHPSGLRALPLTEAACARYSAERETLMRLGVREHLLKGADWAQANLTQPQLDLIHRYIRIEEALKFRCPEEFAALPVVAADEPRRLDVLPPVPARKQVLHGSEAGISQDAPPPPVKGPREQG